jgi:hypothetical protein
MSNITICRTAPELEHENDIQQYLTVDNIEWNDDRRSVTMYCDPNHDGQIWHIELDRSTIERIKALPDPDKPSINPPLTASESGR